MKPKEFGFDYVLPTCNIFLTNSACPSFNCRLPLILITSYSFGGKEGNKTRGSPKRAYWLPKKTPRLLGREACDAWLGNREERKEEGVSDRGGGA